MEATESKSEEKQTAIDVCEHLRPIIYGSSMGLHWPFMFDEKENKLSICKKMTTKPDDIPIIFLSLGKVTNARNVPEVVYRLDKKTSQGKIFVVRQKVNDADVTIVAKADKINSQDKDLWFTQSPRMHIKGEHDVHVIIADAYMDALCSILLSNLVESGQSPHFPICYGTNVSYTKLKRNTRKNQGGTLSQVIWMEYLPSSLYYYLKDQTDSCKWWASIFQVVVALVTAHNHYRFIHNDAHCANIRLRKVAKDTILYYQTDDGVKLAVPTHGNICVLIDFGRACIAPYQDSGLLVSSEFASGGACHGYIPDTRGIDIVRFILSIEDELKVVKDVEGKKALQTFFKDVCATNNGVDLFKEVSKKPNLGYYLDELPRKVCKKSIPEDVLKMFYNTFRCESFPDDAEVYQIKV